MSARESIRNRFVDGPNSLGAKARARRLELFHSRFPELADATVVDYGGTVEAWMRAPVKPKHVHVLNLEKQPTDLPSWIEADYADVTALPADLAGRTYDICFSNAVIEHVGGYLPRRRFAEAVHAAASRSWIQTPYRYFPVEPHWVAPGMQFLPLAARTRVARHWPLVHTRPRDDEDALETTLSVELIGKTEMRHLFPDSEIFFERLAGLPKSIIAVR